MSDQLPALLNLSKKIAQDAGKILLKGQAEGFSVEYKGKSNLVTEVDKKSEQFIVSVLKQAYPDHSILGEEGTKETHSAPYRWIIDPIDGTTDFAHGHPYYCVSIGLEINGEIAVGAVYAPVFKELFCAARGMGAFLNDKKISVSGIDSMEESLLGTGFNPSAPEISRQNIAHFGYFQERSHGIRRCGAAALDICYVAAGRLDGFWENGLSPWDMAAGKIIVEEAGGKITALNGSPFNIERRQILATNGRIHEEMVEYFKKAAA